MSSVCPHLRWPLLCTGRDPPAEAEAGAFGEERAQRAAAEGALARAPAACWPASADFVHACCGARPRPSTCCRGFAAFRCQLHLQTPLLSPRLFSCCPPQERLYRRLDALAAAAEAANSAGRALPLGELGRRLSGAEHAELEEAEDFGLGGWAGLYWLVLPVYPHAPQLGAGRRWRRATAAAAVQALLLFYCTARLPAAGASMLAPCGWSAGSPRGLISELRSQLAEAREAARIKVRLGRGRRPGDAWRSGCPYMSNARGWALGDMRAAWPVALPAFQ